jgi:hypothetical protein
MKWLELSACMPVKNRQRMELTPPPNRRTLAPIGAGLSAASVNNRTDIKVLGGMQHIMICLASSATFKAGVGPGIEGGAQSHR